MQFSWQPYLPYNAVSCRYSEIGTKGRNRGFFVQRLTTALHRRLARWFGNPRFVLEEGRIFMLPEGKDAVLTPEQLAALRAEIPGLPGIASVSPGFLLEPDLPTLESCILETFPKVYEAFVANFPPEERTYTMRANRSVKTFPMRSAELERHFAERLLPGRGLTLDLRGGNLRIEVDIRAKRAFVDYERIEGPGGLPTGSAGSVLALLSGGFDSPVACYEMMRRGCNVDFITFHSSPYTPPATITKVCGIVRKLNEFQKRGRLVAVNLLPVQKAIRDACEDRHRTVLYRRCMTRLATVVARHFEDTALVTGDNLGQVASQTLANLDVISRATPMLILRPLLTYDKLDIMRAAERIGTAALSLEKVPDSCTVFAPENPATNAHLDAVLADEAKLDLPRLLRECLRNTVIMNALTYSEHPFVELLNQELPL